jgi:GntR family transcriptional regulator, transcriptional repressor for pyruvate dehydrogenase complex
VALRFDTEAVLPAVRAPKTAELIAARLRGQIVRGELRPGSRLPPEAELQEQFGVSRPTLREAFRILEAESLLTVRRGACGGAQVVTPDLVRRRPARRQPAAGQRDHDRRGVRGAAGDRADRGADAGLAPAPGGAGRAARVRGDAAVAAAHRPAAGRLGAGRIRLPRPRRRARRQQGARRGGRVLREIAATHIAIALARSYGRSDTPASMARAVRSFGKLVDLVAARDGDGAEKHWRTHLQVAYKTLFGAEAAASVLDLYEKPARA